ncbi:DNA polymerase [Lonomia obliqua multiple nucleopolyhedrovirus]|uniref:DNA polymerase n=1 Tax=Lonomia obliqua multiple nucleopolyhedrovirus TaxID=134394 RepID=A0A126FC58_9ABAC|nr:DNA polymerase [Lonomia obliqua multiple nucleopolyhedrovirus]AKN80986.1 DNA polymerase [Lonomia obliqua multiple nucleopolyhedrovirus]
MKIYTYNELKSRLDAFVKPSDYTLSPGNVFRVIRLTYDENNGYLFVFCNTKINADKETLQFYFKVKLDLYSYKECYNKHIFPTCRNKCVSYVTFVAPGLKRVHLDKINVIKYKRNGASPSENNNCLDRFLHNVNRVHMQTPFVEGKYMKFKHAQQCKNNYISMQNRMFTLDRFDCDFEIVNEMTLTANIMPVVACYDIETHSDGHNMSKASVDFIISIGLVVLKDNTYHRFCFMYDTQDYTLPPSPQREEEENCKPTAVVVFKHELDMITSFLELIKMTNPDVILDFNGDVFDLPFIIERLRKTKFTLKRYDLPGAEPITKLFINKLGNKVNTYYFNNYIHIDLYKLFSTDANQNKVENFQLNTISSYFLGENKIDLHWTEMLKLYKIHELRSIAQYNVQDCMLPVKLFIKLKMADSMYSQCILHRLCTDDVICNISHLISVAYFYKAITNTRFNSETNCHEPDPYFFNKNDLSIISGQMKPVNGLYSGISKLNRKRIPVKCIPATAINLGPANQSVKYKGGKVLKPRAGIYKYAFSLDFNSLYLTIMIMICACLSNLVLCEDGNVYLNQDKDAINVKLLMELLRQRSGFKKNRDNQNESEFLYDLYDQMQNSVKRTANSIYGYYGIFYKALANHITKVGRNQLRTAMFLVESMSEDSDLLKQFNLTRLNFKVIYGDTDSTFILPAFNYDEMPENIRMEKLKQICNSVADKINMAFNGSYKMAFENLMCTLILLKKKKYCYLNSENKITYKGWLIKKDMPVFMRQIFRQAIEQILRYEDILKCLKCLVDNFTLYYYEFGKAKPMTDYSFSMTYNDNPSGRKRKIDSSDAGDKVLKKRVITIARHCREILLNKGTDFVPGNGDRIPYLLIDIEGKVTEKAYPLRLFDPINMRISWIKHMNILCTFMNELLEILGDDYREQILACFKTITQTYMKTQVYDKKEPVLIKIQYRRKKLQNTKKLGNQDDGDDSGGEDSNGNDSESDDNDDSVVTANNTYKFCLYKIKNKIF